MDYYNATPLVSLDGHPITGNDVFWGSDAVGDGNPPSSSTDIIPETSVAGVSSAPSSMDLGPERHSSEGSIIPTSTSIVTMPVDSRPLYSSGSINSTPGMAMSVNRPCSAVPVVRVPAPGYGQPFPFYPGGYNPQMVGYPFHFPSGPSAAAGGPNQVAGPTYVNQASSFEPLMAMLKAELAPIHSRLSELENGISQQQAKVSSSPQVSTGSPVSPVVSASPPVATSATSVSSCSSSTTVVSVSPPSAVTATSVSSCSSSTTVVASSTSSEVSVSGPSVSFAEDTTSRAIDDDCFSIAPNSQEYNFLDHDFLHQQGAGQVVSDSISADIDPDSNPVSDSSKDSKDVLRARVYHYMRDVAKVPFASPPRSKRAPSTFETSCGLVEESSPSYPAFPESNHVSNTLKLINSSVAEDFSEKQGSKFSGFGPSSFPGIFSVKDFSIFNSTLGRIVPTCDKAMSNLIGSKPIDGLRLSQSLWSKSENLLRNSSQVLGSAEHYLSASGSLLQDMEGEGISELKGFLLQVDKALAASQCLILGALANFSLAKRKEILDNSKVSETLKDSLLKSPFTDKIFGLPLEKVQEEVNKTPQAVSVNVRVNDGKRTVSSVQSSQPAFVPAKKKKVVRKKSSNPVSSSGSGSGSFSKSSSKSTRGGKKPGSRT